MEETMVLHQQERKLLRRLPPTSAVALVALLLLASYTGVTVKCTLSEHDATRSPVRQPHSLVSAATNASRSLGDAVTVLTGAGTPCSLLPPYNVAGAL